MKGNAGNARGTYECGCKVPGERRGMQGNSREYRGMPGERMEVGAKCQGNAWEWVYSSRGMQGTTRGMQESGCKVLAE